MFFFGLDLVIKMATFNVRTLIHIRKYGYLACEVETPMFYLRDSPSMQAEALSNLSVIFHLHLSEEPKADASCLAAVGLELCERAEVMLFDKAPVSRLRFKWTCKVANFPSGTKCVYRFGLLDYRL